MTEIDQGKKQGGPLRQKGPEHQEEERSLAIQGTESGPLWPGCDERGERVVEMRGERWREPCTTCSDISQK